MFLLSENSTLQVKFLFYDRGIVVILPDLVALFSNATITIHESK